MAKSQAEIALGILDSVAPHTLNAIVCDLIKAGNIEQLRAAREIKGDVGFIKPDGLRGFEYKNVFDVAVGAGKIDVVRELLAFGLEPAVKLSVSGLQKAGEYTATALDHAFDKVVDAKGDVERTDAIALATVIYDAVKDKLPPLASVHLRYSDSDTRSGGTPAKVLGERTYKIGNEREVPKRVKFESFLDHCISNRVGPLVEAILTYAESFPQVCFSGRSAELFVATHDLANFERLMGYTGEVDSFLMHQILKLPHDLQAKARSIIADHEIDPGIIDKLGDYAQTMAPETLRFLLEKCSTEPSGGMVSLLLVKALRSDNVPLARELVAAGEGIGGWDINAVCVEYVAGSYGEKQAYPRYPIHECRSGDAARLLCAHGADIEQQDTAGKTPLQAMVSDGRVERGENKGGSERGPGLLSALLDAGADMTARFQGRTLTQLAGPRSDEVKAILRAGKTQVLLGDSVKGGEEAGAPAGRRNQGPSAM
jgi:hypothetical protein